MKGAFFNERIFHQDLALCLAKKGKTILREHKVNVLKWTKNSPDLNSIENLWAPTKFRPQKLDYTVMPKLIEPTI